MGLETGITTQARVDFLSGVHCLTDKYRVVLYTSDANLGKDAKYYTPDGECQGKGYRRGGMALSNPKVWEDRGAGCLTWDSVTIPNSTITARGFAIINATKDKRIVCLVDYGAEYTSTEGPFHVKIASDQVVIE